MTETTPHISGRHRIAIALVMSIAINLGMVYCLGNLHAHNPDGLEDNRRVIGMNIVDAPPPQPPKANPDESQATTTLIRASAMPPLDLPPASSNLGSIEVPKTDLDSFDWELELVIPDFSGRSGKDLGMNAASVATPPVLLYQPDLASYYPGRARRAQITGKTQLILHLDAKGLVVRVAIKSSTPEGVFERAARRAAQRLRYQPSVRNGRPQSSKVSMEFIWKLD